MDNKSYLTKKTWFDWLISCLKESGTDSLSKNFFLAKVQQTVTRFVHNKNIPVVELEINSVFLTPYQNDIQHKKRPLSYKCSCGSLINRHHKFIYQLIVVKTEKNR